MKPQTERIHFDVRLNVQDLMTPDPLTIQAGETAAEAGAMMRRHHIGSCIVIRNNIPVGIVTEQDLTRKIIAEDRIPTSVLVDDVMSQPLVTISDLSTVGESTLMMMRHEIRRLPVVDATGGVIGIISVRDVLKFTNELYRVMGDLTRASGIVMLMDTNRDVLWVNHDAPHGKPNPKSESSLNCYELLHNASKPCVGCPFEKVVSSHEGLLAEVTNEQQHVWEVAYQPVIDEAGTLIGVLGAATDVTLRRELEKRLAKKEAELDLALEGGNLGTWYSMPPDADAFLGDKGLMMLGYAPGDRDTIRTLLRVLHPEDYGIFQAAIHDVMDHPAKTSVARFRLRHKDGRWIWLQSVLRVIEIDAEGHPALVGGVATDISELLANQEAILRANEKLNLLSNITRHDILNQVTAVNLMLELIMQHIKGNPDAETHDYLNCIREATDNIERQIKFTSDYQDLGVNIPNWQNVGDLETSIFHDECYKLVTLDLQTNNLEIYADPMFRKVLYNLFEDSIHHGGNVTQFTLSHQTEENGVCILIYEDDGIGIRVEDKKQIFKRGFGQNTGFGLFLSQEILAITGITIAETGTFGTGARFEMTIPKDAWRLS